MMYLATILLSLVLVSVTWAGNVTYIGLVECDLTQTLDFKVYNEQGAQTIITEPYYHTISKGAKLKLVITPRQPWSAGKSDTIIRQVGIYTRQKRISITRFHEDEDDDEIKSLIGTKDPIVKIWTKDFDGPPELLVKLRAWCGSSLRPKVKYDGVRECGTSSSVKLKVFNSDTNTLIFPQQYSSIPLRTDLTFKITPSDPWTLSDATTIKTLSVFAQGSKVTDSYALTIDSSSLIGTVNPIELYYTMNVQGNPDFKVLFVERCPPPQQQGNNDLQDSEKEEDEEESDEDEIPELDLEDGESLKCIGDANKNKVYRYNKAKNEINWYPNPTIASLHDTNWRDYTFVDCSGIPEGPKVGYVERQS